MNDTLAMLALSRVPHIGPRRGIELVRYFGTPSAVWLATQQDLVQSGIVPIKVAQDLRGETYLNQAETVLKMNREQGILTEHFFGENYPGRLKHIPDPPLILFVKGKISILNHPRSIAIVGTRMPSSYGVEMVKELLRDIKIFEPHIISGFAYGIDIHAHKEALSQGLATSVILGNGIDKIYPSIHKKYIPDIIQTGCLTTEFALGVKAEREYFPMRNRIVAGLADLTIVVESKTKGGSMITAWMANEYQREVATFPGSVRSPLSQGPHHLIKSNQAHLIENAGDVVEMMRWTQQPSTSEQMKLFENLNEEEEKIMNVLRQNQDIHIDELSYQSQLDAGDMALHLLQLEMKSLIKTLPGSRVSLT